MTRHAPLSISNSAVDGVVSVVFLCVQIADYLTVEEQERGCEMDPAETALSEEVKQTSLSTSILRTLESFSWEDVSFLHLSAIR